MSNFISIDPGSPTGYSIFNPEGIRLHTCQVEYSISEQYKRDFRNIIENWDVEFALIEKFENFGRGKFNAFKVQAQIQLLIELFPEHILLNTMQWNPQRHNEALKKQLCLEYFGEPLRNTHQRDSALMGQKLFDRVKNEIPNNAFEAMLHRAKTIRKWPRLQDLNWFCWWEKVCEEQIASGGINA